MYWIREQFEERQEETEAQFEAMKKQMAEDTKKMVPDDWYPGDDEEDAWKLAHEDEIEELYWEIQRILEESSEFHFGVFWSIYDVERELNWWRKKDIPRAKAAQADQKVIAVASETAAA